MCFQKVVASGLFSSLPNYKILDWPKLKAFADYNLNVTRMMISLYDRVENIAGKKEDAGYQKAPFTGSLKVGIVW